MKYAIGNEKLGSNCYVVSRPVGDTCPTSCYFLGNGCYAQSTEKRFPNARTAAAENLITDRNKIRALILDAIKRGKSIRIHERGDFGIGDDIDADYVDSWRWACESVVNDGLELPNIWTYTHFYRREIVKALGKYIKLYASVHNRDDIKAAKRAGFKLFAFIDTDHLFTRKKTKGTSNDSPKRIEFSGQKFVVCPEQRMGRTKVTCTGSKGTTACKWCVRNGGENVAFIEH